MHFVSANALRMLGAQLRSELMTASKAKVSVRM